MAANTKRKSDQVSSKQPDASIEGIAPMRHAESAAEKTDLNPINKYDELNQTQAQVEAEHILPSADTVQKVKAPIKNFTPPSTDSDLPSAKTEITPSVKSDALPKAPGQAKTSAFSRVETNIGIDENVGDVINSEAMDISGDAKEVIDRIEEVWSRLDEDDIELYADSRDAFLTRVVDAYGVNKADAERQLCEIEADCGVTAGSSDV